MPCFDTRFHCVYLLSSLDPQCDYLYYIGYTVNPLRRLRQHNGEIVNGAKKTSRRGRPWVMVLCVSGFSEDRIALKFEYCWQHPTKSVIIRDKVAQLKGLRSLAFAIGVLHVLLRAKLFSGLALTINILHREKFDAACRLVATREVAPLAPSPTLRIEDVTPEILAEKIPNDGREDGCLEESDIEREAEETLAAEDSLLACTLCGKALAPLRFLSCSNASQCPLRAHIICLAMWFFHFDEKPELVPSNTISCPICDTPLQWGIVIRDFKRRCNRYSAETTKQGKILREPVTLSQNAAKRRRKEDSDYSSQHPQPLSQQSNGDEERIVVVGEDNRRNDEECARSHQEQAPPATFQSMGFPQDIDEWLAS